MRTNLQSKSGSKRVLIAGGLVSSLLLLIPSAKVLTQAAADRKSQIVELESDRKPSVEVHGACLIKNGTVITVTNGTFAQADVLVSNGKIVSVGKSLSAPAGVPVIDATGKFVTPGIVDAHSHIASDATNEGTDSITAEVRIQDVLNPESVSIWRGLSNGVTTSLVLHGSANAIGGQSSVIKMKYRRTSDDMQVPDAPRMIKFALGENVKRSGRAGDTGTRYPVTRLGVESVYRRAFSEARAYMDAWDQYEKDRLNTGTAAAPRRDLRLEALADVLRRKIWVQCHCYRADEMLMMVRLSQEFGFKIGALQHALEAYRIAPELAAAHIPVSTFADSWAYKIEAFEAVPYNAAMCTRAGIVTSVNSDNGAGAYRLNLEAAKTIKFGGLTEQEAWRLITINPAIQLGVDRRTGSLEAGKDADIAIWSGHPFTVSSKCVETMVEGEVYFTRRDAFGVDKTAVTRSSIPSCASSHIGMGSPPPAHAYAIVGAQIHPVSGPDISNGTLLIVNDRIAAVGVRISIPRGAFVIHASGLHIYPGLIDAGSTLGLDEIGEVPVTSDVSEAGMFQPDLRALTAVNAASEHILIARADGVTTTLTRPAAGGGFRGGGAIIPGQGAIMDLDGWTSEQMQIRSPASLHIAFPEVRSFGRGRGGPTADALQRQRDGVKEQTLKLREFLEKGQRYAASHTATAGGPPADPQLEALRPYLAGKLPVVFSVSTAIGIRTALEFAESFHLKTVIETGAASITVAELLAAKKASVIYHLPIQNSIDSSAPPHEYDPYDSVFAAPGILQRAGVPIAFASADNAMVKNLPSQVGITRGFGLSEGAALRAMTIGAATVLGVNDQIGSLEPGKIANVILTDGDPLEITTHLHALFIAGNAVSLENKHTRMYERYMRRITSMPTPSTAGRSGRGKIEASRVTAANSGR